MKISNSLSKAVVDTDGKQIPMVVGQRVYIDYRDVEKGSYLRFDRVLAFFDGDKHVVGTPYIEGALVEAEVLDVVKGAKVVVFKKKRRKGYKCKRGFRKKYTLVRIDKINGK